MLHPADRLEESPPLPRPRPLPLRPGFSGRELLQVLQRGQHVEQLLVEGQGEVEVHHGGVVDGETTDDPNQVKPFLLYKTLKYT